MDKKLSELTDTELGALVAERRGLRFRQYDDEEVIVHWPTGETTHWDPCNRADHWWRVVEWVREGLFSTRFSFMEALRKRAVVDVSYPDKNMPERVPPLWWFMLHSRPGRAICEAYAEATE